jgi:hypothetical protein
MSGDDAFAFINQDRVCPAKFLNRGGNLCHLLIGMRPAVSRVWRQRCNAMPNDIEVSHRVISFIF